MIFLLQLVASHACPAWLMPFHRAGTGLYPESSKLRDSGHIPAAAQVWSSVDDDVHLGPICGATFSCFGFVNGDLLVI
jgi:hypothetical protein